MMLCCYINKIFKSCTCLLFSFFLLFLSRIFSICKWIPTGNFPLSTSVFPIKFSVLTTPEENLSYSVSGSLTFHFLIYSIRLHVYDKYEEAFTAVKANYILLKYYVHCSCFFYGVHVHGVGVTGDNNCNDVITSPHDNRLSVTDMFWNIRSLKFIFQVNNYPSQKCIILVIASRCIIQII